MRHYTHEHRDDHNTLHSSDQLLFVHILWYLNYANPFVIKNKRNRDNNYDIDIDNGDLRSAESDKIIDVLLDLLFVKFIETRWKKDILYVIYNNIRIDGAISNVDLAIKVFSSLSKYLVRPKQSRLTDAVSGLDQLIIMKTLAMLL